LRLIKRINAEQKSAALVLTCQRAEIWDFADSITEIDTAVKDNTTPA
jgi:hypothetical protein